MRLPALPTTSPAHQLPLWPPLLATRGPGAKSALHAHHALHLVLALEGRLALRSSVREPWSEAAGVLTAPDVPHAIDASGCEVLLVFFEPESQIGVALTQTLGGVSRSVSERERDALLRDADPLAIMQAHGADWSRRMVRTLGAPAVPASRSIHPRVKQLLRLLRATSVEDAVSLEALAAQVKLSPGRLMHVFTESIGIPLRPYLAWLKLQRAAGAIVSGMPLAEAAHAAGFSDSAHMSRTFRRMFGVKPSELRPKS